MSELVRLGDREAQVLCPVELAITAHSRMRGLLGRDALEGALLLCPASSVHTFGMRFAIDVAWCTAPRGRDAWRGPFTVIDVVTLVPNRMTRPRRGVRLVIETAAGVLGSLGVGSGATLEVKTEAL